MQMRKFIVILIFAIMPLIYINGIDNAFSIESKYGTTIYPVGAKSIFDTEATMKTTNMNSLPINPGEPEPDPEPTPVGDIPIILLGILGICYCSIKLN